MGSLCLSAGLSDTGERYLSCHRVQDFELTMSSSKIDETPRVVLPHVTHLCPCHFRLLGDIYPVACSATGEVFRSFFTSRYEEVSKRG